MFIATNWDPIYWDCACLIVNSGSLEDDDEFDIQEDDESENISIKRTASTDYGKIAKAMGEIISAGIKISLVDINHSDFGFKPDAENNQILYGMKGLLNVSDTVIENIIVNRPYSSPKDFLLKVRPNKQAMISLIKGGAFDSMIDRKLCMGWYIWETCDKKKRITLQNMGGLIKYNLLPEKTEEQITARRVYEFNRYLKAVCKNKNDMVNYHVDDRAINFLTDLQKDDLLDGYLLNIKSWDKVYQNWMNIFREWISQEKEQILQNLNEKIFKDDWEKYALGTLSSWEMQALCFYYHEHELSNVDKQRYGFIDFNRLPEEPTIEKSFSRGSKTINIFKLSKICGTCIAKNKTKSTVTILTTSGVVNVKFRKEYFSLFDKQISERQNDGSKKVMEKSWFNRGNMIIITGIRSGDDFISKKYANTNGHQLYKIDEINADGSLKIRSDRYQGENIE